MSGYSRKISKLKNALNKADAVVVGAGSGLSACAGFEYSGERFEKYFFDLEKRFGFHDMYSGGFYPYQQEGNYWAFWSRYIYINRYADPPKPAYSLLLELVKDKDYFVITTNVDHCFQKAGFDKKRLFYTQGDYGLFQCSFPCRQETFDNRETIEKMLLAQGFEIGKEKELILPEKAGLDPSVPEDLFPFCPYCRRPMAMNLRSDDTFAEDEGWHQAAERYENFLRTRRGEKIVFLELGVGYNTPTIIKYPFWQMTLNNPWALYCCVNDSDASGPFEIETRSIYIEADILQVIKDLLEN